MEELNNKSCFIIFVVTCFAFIGCGPTIPVVDARLGLVNGPTRYNEEKVIPSVNLDNCDKIVGSCYIDDDLRKRIIAMSSDGIDFYVVVGVSYHIVYVNYELHPVDYDSVKTMDDLTRKLKNIILPLGIYHNEYVPYSTYMRIGPESERICIVK